MPDLNEAIALYDAKAYEKAYEIFVELGRKRDSEALFYLGMMYFYGEGVDADEAKCMEYWRQAMREGHREAAYRLSEIRTSTKTTF